MADLTAASNLFVKSSRLVEFLLKGCTPGIESASVSASKPTARTFAPGFGAIQNIPKRLEAMWVTLYECGHVQAEDVRNLQLWLKVLLSDGYTFPTSFVTPQTNSGDSRTIRTAAENDHHTTAERPVSGGASGGCNLAKMTTCSQKLAASGMTDACKLAKVSLACFSDECKSGAHQAAWTTAETTAKTACATTGGGGTLVGTSRPRTCVHCSCGSKCYSPTDTRFPHPLNPLIPTVGTAVRAAPPPAADATWRR